MVYSISGAPGPTHPHISSNQQSIELDHYAADAFDAPKPEPTADRVAFAEPTSIAAAVEALGHGPFHHTLLVICGASLLALVTELLNIGHVANSIACELPISAAQRALLLSAAFFGVVLTAHGWGYATDRWGRRRALQWSCASAALCSTVSALCATNIGTLIIGRLLTGACVSGLQSAALVYLGEFHGPRRRGRAVTQAAMCMVVALMYMAIVAWAVLPLRLDTSWAGGLIRLSAWRLDLCCGSLPLVLIFGALHFLPESAQFLLAQGRSDEALAALRRAHRWNHGSHIEYSVRALKLEAMQELDGIWSQTRPILVRPLVGSTALMGYLSFVLFAVAHGMNMWMPWVFGKMAESGKERSSGGLVAGYEDENYMRITPSVCQLLRGTVDRTDAAACSSAAGNPVVFQMLLAYTAACVLVFYLVTLLMDRISLRLILIVWFVCSALGAIALIWLPIGRSGSLVYVSVAVFVVFLSCGNCGSIVGAVAQDLFPVRVRAMALCAIFALGRIGSVAGSSVIGWALMRHGSCEAVFAVSAALLVSCAALVVWCLPEQQRSELTSAEQQQQRDGCELESAK